MYLLHLPLDKVSNALVFILDQLWIILIHFSQIFSVRRIIKDDILEALDPLVLLCLVCFEPIPVPLFPLLIPLLAHAINIRDLVFDLVVPLDVAIRIVDELVLCVPGQRFWTHVHDGVIKIGLLCSLPLPLARWVLEEVLGHVAPFCRGVVLV